MDAVLLQRCEPEVYYRRFLDDGVRPDGRAPHDRRAAQLQRGAIGSAHGSASVRLGLSTAVAGVRAEITESIPELPAHGQVMVSIEFPPLCSAVFRERQRALSLSTFLSNALTDILNSANVFDHLQLGIREGQVFWNLHLQVVCLNHDGNAFDLCLLAALAALEDTVLPALAEDPLPISGMPVRFVEAAVGSAGAIVCQGRSVKLVCRPLPVTFTKLPGEHWALDPSAEEEALGPSVSLCLVGGKWLVFHPGGGGEVERFLSELMPVARTCVGALTDLLGTAKNDVSSLVA